MSAACRSFRALLELKLSGRTAQSELAELSWHEHLLACGACRELLAAEEALELLLASLPEPRLPPELARRVISRLRDAQRRDLAETGLDALLDLDRTEAPPAHLAQSVLARLRDARHAEPAGVSSSAHGADPRESRLDALLDLSRAVAVPDGLAARVLDGLRSVRSSDVRARRTPRLAGRRVRWLIAAAALVVAFWLARNLWVRSPDARLEERTHIVNGPPPQSSGAIASDAPAPEPQLLAVMDVLEQWDLLMHGDIDVLLSTLEPVELESIEEQPPEKAEPPPETPRSKG